MALRKISNAKRGTPIFVIIDGRKVRAFEGETIASVLLVEGVRTFNRSVSSKPRGPYCGIGVCFECLVRIECPSTEMPLTPSRWARACMTPIQAGMAIKTGFRAAEYPLIHGPTNESR